MVLAGLAHHRTRTQCLPPGHPGAALRTTRSRDPRQIIELRGLLRHLAQDCAVLVTSHILAEIERTADRAAILLDGRLLTVEQIAQEALVAPVPSNASERQATSALRIIVPSRRPLLTDRPIHPVCMVCNKHCGSKRDTS